MDSKTDVDAAPVDAVVMHQLIRAAVRAFAELNAIRARDGVPYTGCGWKSDVDEAYFSSVVDGLDEAVKAATGKSAHCHPELYARWDEDDPYDEDRDCHKCGGEGWVVGSELDDPLRYDDNEAYRCPCCRGSGNAKDCIYW